MINLCEKQFEIKVDDVDSSIINITRDGEDFAWFLSDVITDKQVEKVVDLLNDFALTIDKLDEDNTALLKENEQLREIVNKLEEAIEKRGYDSIDEFW